jgi:HK97 family phage major capsid protein
MSEVINVDALKSDIAESFKKIEEGYAPKHVVAKLEEQLAAFKSEADRRNLSEVKDRYFGTMEQKRAAVTALVNAVKRSPLAHKLAEPGFLVHKTDSLNSYTSGAGAELVPTAIDSAISMLMYDASVIRRDARLVPGIQGYAEFPRRTSRGTSVRFTTSDVSGNPLGDNGTLVGDAPNLQNLQITPHQIAGCADVSEKLLYNSVANVIEFIYRDMVDQSAYLEDTSALNGDGSSTSYGGCLGIVNDDDVPEDTVASASFGLDKIATLPTFAHESIVNGKFYMNRHTLATLRTAKASTAGSYHIDPTSGQPELFGVPVVVWNRMANVGAGNYPVIYGDLSRAAVVGLGRPYEIKVDYSNRFRNVEATFRLVYDWDFGLIEPSAVARLKTT